MPCRRTLGEPMRRREFIAALGTAAWPFAAHAQQRAMLPTVGFLSNSSPGLYARRLRAFHQGLAEAGYVEGQDVTIEYRWAEGKRDQLAALAAELVQRRVALIVAAGGTPVAMAAKAATPTIPIVFGVGSDPVKLGLVKSLNQPGGNLTGVTNPGVEVGPKRLELVREMLPTANLVSVLVDPASPEIAEQFSQALIAAASKLGLQVRVLQASTEPDFDRVFAELVQSHASALVITPDVFFTTKSEQLAALSLRYAVPAIFQFREFAAAGGLMSYGSDETEYMHLIGAYAGRVLKGEKPKDLPIIQAAKVELILNLKTAKALGITVPLSLLGRADEVIE
jgi:putative tryptophan/tyrosine transport system substrate-binding protein